MKNAIEKIGPDTFILKTPLAKMTLRRHNSGWRMLTDNASARAWNRMESSKDFADLAAVEAHYKSWRGISLVVATASQAPQGGLN